MAARHLVADAQLAFTCDINFDLLDDPRFDLLAAFDAVGRTIPLKLKLRELMLVRANDFSNPVPNRAWVDLNVIVRRRQLSQ